MQNYKGDKKMNTKNYIRLNENKEIIKSFSTDFEQPEKDDICVNENGDRHYNLDLIDIYTMGWKLKYIDGKIIEKTRDELDNDSRYVYQKTQDELLQTDKDIPRALEDMYDLLVVKNVIKETDIPTKVKEKLLNKKALRDKVIGE